MLSPLFRRVKFVDRSCVIGNWLPLQPTTTNTAHVTVISKAPLMITCNTYNDIMDYHSGGGSIVI